MIAVLILMALALVVVGSALLIHVAGTGGSIDEVTDAHVDALHTAQRVHALVARSRQALWAEARRQRDHE